MTAITSTLGRELRETARTGRRELERVPIYRAGELAGFIRRTARYPQPSESGSERNPQLPADASLRQDIEAVMRTELGRAAEYVRLSVAGGVVSLSGEVANVHDKMALRRIAASMARTIAIIDDVWVSCE